MKTLAQNLIVITTLLALSAHPSLADARVGAVGPDFTAKGIDGKTYRLSDFAGKIVVLEAFNNDCPFCHNHYSSGAMQELQGEMTANGIIWLAVNSSNPSSPSHRDRAEARKEWRKLGMKATAWIDDSSGTVGRAYGLRTTPHMIVIDRDGTIAYDGAIDDTASDSEDPRKARNYVREAINALVAGKPVAVKQTKPYGCGVKY